MRLNSIRFSIIIMVIFMQFSCKQEKNIVTLSPDPVIDSVELPAKWNTRLNLLYKVEVKVLDAQGFANIDTVLMEVIDANSEITLFKDQLYDDGAFYYPQDGDVMALDGVYSNQYTARQVVPAQSTAECIIKFKAIDKQGNQSLIDNRPVLFSPNYPPAILNISAPDTFSIIRLRPVIQISVADSDGIADISRSYLNPGKDKPGFLNPTCSTTGIMKGTAIALPGIRSLPPDWILRLWSVKRVLIF
jgi:hypothetical protein